MSSRKCARNRPAANRPTQSHFLDVCALAVENPDAAAAATGADCVITVWCSGPEPDSLALFVPHHPVGPSDVAP